MKIRDVMRTSVPTAGRHDSVRSIARMLAERDTEVVVITDGEKIAGIFTASDLVPVIVEGRDPDDVPVERYMTTVTPLSPDMDIEQAARIMSEQGIRSLPVVEGELLIGRVSADEIPRTGDTSEPTEERQEILTVRVGDRESRPPRTRP
jgi:CBS domain-containing protein